MPWLLQAAVLRIKRGESQSLWKHDNTHIRQQTAMGRLGSGWYWMLPVLIYFRVTWSDFTSQRFRGCLRILHSDLNWPKEPWAASQINHHRTKSHMICQIIMFLGDSHAWIPILVLPLKHCGLLGSFLISLGLTFPSLQTNANYIFFASCQLHGIMYV